tara:strand:- start:2961 stop:3173 length:213 start_codon:yes stop_codon:yes gene_type:complete
MFKYVEKFKDCGNTIKDSTYWKFCKDESYHYYIKNRTMYRLPINSYYEYKSTDENILKAKRLEIIGRLKG